MKRLKSDIWTQIDELSDRTSIGTNGRDRDLSLNSHDQSLGIFDCKRQAHSRVKRTYS